MKEKQILLFPFFFLCLYAKIISVTDNAQNLQPLPKIPIAPYIYHDP
jgi:hypothetical protein